MRRNLFIALGLAACVSSAAPAFDDSGKGKGRHGRGGDRDERRDNVALFRALDNNRDGLISRAEWRGSARSFDVLDRNDDGVISRGELGVRHR